MLTPAAPARARGSAPSAVEKPVPAGAPAGRRSYRLAWVLVGVAMVLRLGYYVVGEPYWIDEAWLALNIVERGWLELLAPLDHRQGAPPGFLYLLRSAYLVGGANEYVLRVWPLSFGLMSVLFFHAVARRVLAERVVVVGLALFAFSMPLIRYSAEVKQYSLDVAVALAIVLAVLRVERLSARVVAGLGLFGAVAVWLSHPSVFVLAAAGLVLAASEWRRVGWRALLPAGVLAAVWLASFGVLYLIQLRELMASDFMARSWRGGFMPLGSGIVEWARRRIWLFDDAVGFGLLPTWVFAVAVVGGVVRLALVRRYRELTLLAGPIAFTLLASALHVYPFAGRLILFLVPSLLLLAASAVSLLRWRMLPITGAVTLVACMVAGAVTFRGNSGLDVRPALRHIESQARAGDMVITSFVSRGAREYSWYVVDLYARHYGLIDRGVELLDPTVEPAIDGGARVWALSYEGAAGAAAAQRERLARLRQRAAAERVRRFGEVDLYRLEYR